MAQRLPPGAGEDDVASTKARIGAGSVSSSHPAAAAHPGEHLSQQRRSSAVGSWPLIRFWKMALTWPSLTPAGSTTLRPSGRVSVLPAGPLVPPPPWLAVVSGCSLPVARCLGELRLNVGHREAEHLTAELTSRWVRNAAFGIAGRCRGGPLISTSVFMPGPQEALAILDPHQHREHGDVLHHRRLRLDLQHRPVEGVIGIRVHRDTAPAAPAGSSRCRSHPPGSFTWTRLRSAILSNTVPPPTSFVGDEIDLAALDVLFDDRAGDRGPDIGVFQLDLGVLHIDLGAHHLGLRVGVSPASPGRARFRVRA